MIFRWQSIQVDKGDGIAQLCFDRQGESINKFDTRTVDELNSATQGIRATTGVRGVLMHFYTPTENMRTAALAGRTHY